MCVGRLSRTTSPTLGSADQTNLTHLPVCSSRPRSRASSSFSSAICTSCLCSTSTRVRSRRLSRTGPATSVDRCARAGTSGSHAEELFLLARRPQMKFITALKPSIKYYNLTNSAWEPLLEPYSFMLRVSCRRRASSRPPFRSHADPQSALGFLSGLSFREWRRCG
jgi:hypothetical protein